MAYIDAKHLFKCETCLKDRRVCDEWCECGERYTPNMFKIPTADVEEVRHGEWVLLEYCANEGVYCSICHKKVYRKDYANQKTQSNYCPNCGAKMDGKGDSE